MVQGQSGKKLDLKISQVQCLMSVIPVPWSIGRKTEGCGHPSEKNPLKPCLKNK
jgi:hypothetical protein